MGGLSSAFTTTILGAGRIFFGPDDTLGTSEEVKAQLMSKRREGVLFLTPPAIPVLMILREGTTENGTPLFLTIYSLIRFRYSILDMIKGKE